MTKKIVNKNFQFSVTQMGANIPGIKSGGLSDVDVEISPKSKAGGDSILTTKIGQMKAASDWSCEGPTKDTTAASETITGGIFNILSTAVKSMSDGKPCMLEGDFAICNCICTAPQKTYPPNTVVTPGICKIMINYAGQDTVKGG